jgi:hypothetical protein
MSLPVSLAGDLTLTQTGVDINGMTFGELIERAKALGVGQPEKNDGDADQLLIPLDEVIVIEPEKEEDASI